MRNRDALKLHNRDEVEVKVQGTERHPSYVLGEPQEQDGRVYVPVLSDQLGYVVLDHTEVA